jgi:hypothetical protein
LRLGNPDLTNGLVVAELTESFMGAQNQGWDCGGSNGEALSRYLAELLSGGPQGVLAGFATGPAWDQAGRPNWIHATEPTDLDAVSIGCGSVYLYWMLSRGVSAARVTQAGCSDGTLASNYQALTGASTAWADFSAAVASLHGAITSDDPWGTSPQTDRIQPANVYSSRALVIRMEISLRRQILEKRHGLSILHFGCADNEQEMPGRRDRNFIGPPLSHPQRVPPAAVEIPARPDRQPRHPAGHVHVLDRLVNIDFTSLRVNDPDEFHPGLK